MAETAVAPDVVSHPFAALDEFLWKLSWDARPRYRGRLHAISAFIAPPAAAAMVINAKPGRNRAAAVVYGVGLCSMFAVSGTYHRLSRSKRMAAAMRRLDHSTIYIMIAGTWTPIAVAVLPPEQARLVLAAVWGVTGVAVGAKVALLDEKHRAGSWFYPVLGVAGAALTPAIARVGGRRTVVDLVGGGAVLLGGALVFALKKPNPWPKVFGFHEIFHTAVVAGVAAHFTAVWRLLGDRSR
ncbi:MAG: hemolysin III family protein [Acidobacteria bacterium]|nr:hemolysin III family protein [Acidobacteriota bacterium]